MKVVVIEKPNAVEVKKVDDPTPGPAAAVLKVEACGICGTDMHMLHGEFAPTRSLTLTLHHVPGITDRTVVLRLGRVVANEPTSSFTPDSQPKVITGLASSGLKQ